MKWHLKNKYEYKSNNYSYIYNQKRTNSKLNLKLEKSTSISPIYSNKYIFLIIIFLIQIQTYLLTNEITLKITVADSRVQILGEKFDQAPSSVTSTEVNVIYDSEVFTFITLYENENFNGNCHFKLTWSEPIYSLQGIFTNLTDLLEVDLSNFNASLVTTMTDMFFGCTSLTSVKFGNLNTSSL